MKHFRNLKGMLCWGKENGYMINPESLNFKSNIQTIHKTVTFLTYDETEKLSCFEFPKSKLYFDHIRDVCLLCPLSIVLKGLFCF